MRNLIAVAGSLVLNLAALGTLEWTVQEAQIAPAGEVIVTQLPDEATLPLYAQADYGDAAQARF